MKMTNGSYVRLRETAQSGKPSSVTSKKLPNIYKSCPKMISLEKLKILTPLQNSLRMGEI